MRIGYIVGSLSSTSINRIVARSLAALAPEGVELFEIPIADLPLYSPDADADYPEVARQFKAAIDDADGVIIVTPEYSRSVPGALKNALDWSSRPWGTNSFNGKPTAIMGASRGAIGTALAQQHLRLILAHANAPTMGQPETFFAYQPAAFGEGGEVEDESAKAILNNFLTAAIDHVELHTRAAASA